MNVGDLVKHKTDVLPWLAANRTGIIIECGVYVGRRDVKIMWDDCQIFTAMSKNFEVISESR